MASLFKFSEIEVEEPLESVEPKSIVDKGIESIRTTIGDIELGHISTWWTNGNWSLYQLVEYCLGITGPNTKMYLATWTISELSARKLNQWIDEGMVSQLVGVLDFRSKNRHPAAFHLSKNAFTDIKLAYSHAKVTVLVGNGHFISINGSANWTENPRFESGTIINSEFTATENIKIITEIVSKGRFGLEEVTVVVNLPE